MILLKPIRSSIAILSVAVLTLVASSFFMLALSQMGLITFTGMGWLVNSMKLISGYLGYSIIFFVPTLFGYWVFFILLKEALSGNGSDVEKMEKIRFYNGGMEIFITLFFAIGVLFTAWGLQNALVSALGGVSKEEAGRLGAWGILKSLVDNGILIALWTTIIGGAGGYMMRLGKYIFLGKALNRFSVSSQQQEKRSFLDTLNSIKGYVEKIEQRLNHAE